MDATNQVEISCYTCTHADLAGNAHPCVECDVQHSHWAHPELTAEPLRDCNTCTHHSQGRSPLSMPATFTLKREARAYACFRCLQDTTLPGWEQDEKLK